METRARERWRADLESWALPPRLLASVPDSPYDRTGPVARLEGEEPEEIPTLSTVIGLAGAGGSVLDIGAGAGRLAIPLARRRHRVTAVEADEDVAEALRDEVRASGTRVTTIIGRWPDVAHNAGQHDVALSAHAVYDVAAIGPFIEAMHRCARRAVVIEATPRHPWAHLARYFRLIHDHELPRRPTVDHLVEVVREVAGVEPRLEWWSAPAFPRFEDVAELMSYYRRRLLVPVERSIEASGYLEADVRQTDAGWLTLGPPEREVVTMWWRTG
jgi:2-polyprenyl-3-methyl-5-hydroxy-6-metoxy-1,4-benzoquinol methylase